MPEKKYKDSDIDEWPKSWEGIHEDIPYGQEIIELFKPFINSMKETGLAKKTVNNHIDNLWLLGGWLIRHINFYPKDRKIVPYIHFLKNIAGLDGPLIHDFGESEQNDFDSTCRKFYKWLISQGYKLPPKQNKKSSSKKAKK